MLTDLSISSGRRREDEGGPTAAAPWVWRRTSFCGETNACVDVAFRPTGVAVRDSKDPSGPVLLFTTAEWAGFLRGVHNGEFELPRGELALPVC
ncbi:DUF397 domain-containing protein [Pseudofrankia sp. DC12]|uniref:DUF397 domain-containing protein n=1 Tax=Pseudofrankia sp. DC12 TaxID=683315 RepID=UPI000A061F36